MFVGMFRRKTDETTSVEDIVILEIGYVQSISLAEYQTVKLFDLTVAETNVPIA